MALLQWFEETKRVKQHLLTDAYKLQCLIRYTKGVYQIQTMKERGANSVTLQSGDTPDVKCARQSAESGEYCISTSS